jgi:uncharacterized protein YjeT (DUF2065 family)
MKKPIVGLVAVGVVVALRPLVKRRMAEKMREHCDQMMRQCAGGHEAMGQAMREQCGRMAAQREERGEPVATA